MRYVALLRGINVGGNRKVEMARLRMVFEQIGTTEVRTYINSGNVVFSSSKRFGPKRIGELEQAILAEFGFPVDTLICDGSMITQLADDLPSDWIDNTAQRCYVMFLWDSAASPSVLDELLIKDGIDDVRYVDGAILWRVPREHLTKSGMQKVIGTPLYKQMTIRNTNTVRKLAELVRAVQ